MTMAVHDDLADAMARLWAGSRRNPVLTKR